MKKHVKETYDLYKKEREELISIWDNLPSYEKRAFGNMYITHQSDFNAWNKPFAELSELKQQRVLAQVRDFSKVKDHCIR